MPFPCLINLSADVWEETEDALSTFVDSTGWRGKQATCSRVPARPEEWANRNLIKFNQDKCNILCFGETHISAPGQDEDWQAGF